MKASIDGVLRHLSGWRRDTPDHRDHPFSLPAPILIPKKVDLRRPDMQIEDQGSLGYCAYCASTSAMEFLYPLAGKPVVQLSRLFLGYANRVWTDHEDPDDDNGAEIREVMKTLRAYGTCPELSWPYVEAKFNVEPPGDAKREAMLHQITCYSRCADLHAVQMSLAAGYPVIGGFRVPANALSDASAKSGIIKYPAQDEGFVGGHAVLIVGYDDALRLLTFENSWGDAWGDSGYGYLPYEFVTTGLADDFWTIRAEEL